MKAVRISNGDEVKIIDEYVCFETGDKMIAFEQRSGKFVLKEESFMALYKVEE